MTEGRRPLAVRGSAWAGRAARWLTERGIAPDAISKASLGFAAAALGFFWLAGLTSGWAAALPFLLAAACVQGRLLCNLFDGMVAVEGGRGGAQGPFWNEVPDRPADIMILLGAGLSCGVPALGLACGAAALGTAYIRALSVGLGHGEDFSGPFAKQQRMAAVTVAAGVTAIETLVFGTVWAMTATLWIVLAGTIFTALRRAATLLGRMG